MQTLHCLSSSRGSYNFNKATAWGNYCRLYSWVTQDCRALLFGDIYPWRHAERAYSLWNQWHCPATTIVGQTWPHIPNSIQNGSSTGLSVCGRLLNPILRIFWSHKVQIYQFIALAELNNQWHQDQLKEAILAVQVALVVNAVEDNIL